MAEISMYMNALAVSFAREKCAGCQRNFERGERMAAVKDSDGNSMGWFCDGCIDDWKHNGVKSRVFKP